MKILFYTGIIGLCLFELANVYFIMPMPGSQEINSINFAYCLYSLRWIFRICFLGLIFIPYFLHTWSKKWIPTAIILSSLSLVYILNFNMAADHMFYKVNHPLMKKSSENKVDSTRLIIGIALEGEAKAYPIQFIGYHHQVYDSLAGKPILVTYCTVCRTGRIFEPIVQNKYESFRLVGMDHFNAMFEDGRTGSWWRQATGEAITGKLKGNFLPELSSYQMPLNQWLAIHPESMIMQADPDYQAKYDRMDGYESGHGKSKLTKRDSLSWHKKSWVIGLCIADKSKVFDWNLLREKRIINDFIGTQPIVLFQGSDSLSFYAFERPSSTSFFTMQKDTLSLLDQRFNLAGIALCQKDSTRVPNLKPVRSYHEFWHSWQTFHPNSEKYAN